MGPVACLLLWSVIWKAVGILDMARGVNHSMDYDRTCDIDVAVAVAMI